MLRSKNELFKHAAGTNLPKLPHPTNSSFDSEKWAAALARVAEPVDDDYGLCATAHLLGREISTVRTYIDNQFVGVSKATALLMITAVANREFSTVREKALKAVTKAQRAGQFSHEMLADIQLYSGNTIDQYANADAVTEAIVDSLPHSYIRTISLKGEDLIHENELAARSVKLAGSTSLEHTFRYIWQNALWSEISLSESEGNFIYEPRSRLNAEIWQAWTIRQTTQNAEASFLKRGDDFERLIPNTITGYERRQGRKHGPIICKAKKWNSTQDFLASKWLSLKASYLGAFLEQPFPLNIGLNVTILFKAWWVISELCETLMADIPRGRHTSREFMKRRALTTKRSVLVNALIDAGTLSRKQAEDSVEFLTANFSNVSRLFNKGLWGNPIIKAATGENLYLVAPVCIMSNPIRTAEYWLDQGGATDSVLLRGKTFERETGALLKVELETNEQVADWSCPTDNLPTKNDGEEIDGLLRIGKKVLVIEYKCFLTPTEPIERYNFLEKLREGCEQVNRKALWIKQNPAIAAKVLAFDLTACSSFDYLPLVVTNQSYGVGFSHGGVPVIDRKYLELLCSKGYYVSDAIVVGATKSAALHRQVLYKKQAEFEEKLTDLLADPIVMQRFKGRFKWGQMPVPTSHTSKIICLVPILEPTEEEIDRTGKLKSMVSI